MRGAYSPGVVPAFSIAFLADAFYHAALPMLVYVLTSLGGWMLVMKSSTVETLGEDYVTVARARGLTDRRIQFQYVGRNAMLPLFTSFALSLGFVVGGSILVEQVTQYQGIGFLLFEAVNRRDYPVLQGILLIVTISVMVANLIADLLYSRVDPRIRITGGGELTGGPDTRSERDRLPRAATAGGQGRRRVPYVRPRAHAQPHRFHRVPGLRRHGARVRHRAAVHARQPGHRRGEDLRSAYARAPAGLRLRGARRADADHQRRQGGHFRRLPGGADLDR